jgi:hypothetical protein
VAVFEESGDVVKDGESNHQQHRQSEAKKNSVAECFGQKNLPNLIKK